MSRNAGITTLKLALTGLLLYLFIHRTDFRGVLSALSQLSYKLIIVLACLNILGVFISAYKWRMLLPEARFMNLLVACFASYYIGLLLPGQLAQEAAKAYYLSLSKSQRMHLIAASVLVDKIVSILGLLLVGCFGLMFSKARLPASLTALFVVSASATTAALFAARIDWLYSAARRFLSRVQTRFPNWQRILGGLSRLLEAWHIYARNLPLLAGNIMVAVLYQFIGVLMFYLLSRELHLSIGFYDWSWIVGALTLALFLPLTVGGLGIREGTLIGILALYGYGSETAVALSLVAFSFVIMVAIIGAALSFTIKVTPRAAI
jgi:hypothetical protein